MELSSNKYSRIELEVKSSLLVFYWEEACLEMGVEEVKMTLEEMLRLIRENSIRHIIIDAFHYPFRNNMEIQKWINHYLMPNVVDASVNKYAIVVGSQILSRELNRGYDDEEVEGGFSIHYFPDLDSAINWIKN